MNEERVFKEIFTDPQYAPKTAKLPFVWQIDYKGATSHFVGTQHFTAINYGPALSEILEGKKRVFLERNMQETCADDYAPVRKYLAEQTIDALPETLHAAFTNIFEKTPAQARTTPVFDLYMRLFLRVIASLDSFYRMEVQIQKRADKRGIPVEGLETTEENHAGLLDEMQNFAQNIPRLLGYGPSVHAHALSAFTALSTAYATGDREAALNAGSLGGTLEDKFNKPLLIQRNRNMAERSLQRLVEPSLVAVGVAHGIVEPSVQTLYREAGAKVERVQ
jgi:uncharacterized protein YbaP (TraB family)